MSQLDSGGGGAAFGIALSVVNGEIRFAAVDDNTNSLDVWTFEVAVAHHRHHGDGSGDDGSGD